MVGSPAFRSKLDGQDPLVPVRDREAAPAVGCVRRRDFWRRVCCSFSDEAFAETRYRSHRGIDKSARKCRYVYRMAGEICGPNIACAAIAGHGGAYPDGEIDCTLSGAKVGPFRGVLPDRYAPQYDARNFRWFGIAESILRYRNTGKMNAG